MIEVVRSVKHCKLTCDWCGEAATFDGDRPTSESGWSARDHMWAEAWAACPAHQKEFDSAILELGEWDQRQRAELERISTRGRGAMDKWRTENPPPNPPQIARPAT